LAICSGVIALLGSASAIVSPFARYVAWPYL
jgi:hypothetical protein